MSALQSMSSRLNSAVLKPWGKPASKLSGAGTAGRRRKVLLHFTFTCAVCVVTCVCVSSVCVTC